MFAWKNEISIHCPIFYLLHLHKSENVVTKKYLPNSKKYCRFSKIQFYLCGYYILCNEYISGSLNSLLFLFSFRAFDSEFVIISACKGKLCFGKQAVNTNLGAEWQPNQIRRPKFAITPQTIRNPKNEKISSHHRAIPKSSNGSSTPPPRFTTGCTSIRTCSDSAIAFSQRQMHDIECITTKLTNELQILKEIAEERLVSGPYPTTSLKYNADEVCFFTYFWSPYLSHPL